MEIKTEKAMPLSNLENRDLRLYLFISRPVDFKILQEGIQLIFSYDLDRAIVKCLQMAPQGYSIKQMGFMPVKELLRNVELGNSITLQKDEKISASPPKTKEQLCWNILLLADEFIEDEDTRQELKKIIEKVK